MSNPFTAHPTSVNETYREHLAFALRFGIKMAVGGLAAMLHAVFPFLFVRTAGKLCDELQEMRKNSPGRKKTTDALDGETPSSNNLRQRENI